MLSVILSVGIWIRVKVSGIFPVVFKMILYFIAVSDRFSPE